MTDNTKMREGKLWAFLHDSIHEAYKKLSTTGTRNEYHALLDSIAAKIANDVDARFLKAAQSELDALRKDAERYRWLRSSSVGPHELFQACLIDLGCGLQTMKSELDLDEAIDAAIAKERQS